MSDIDLGGSVTRVDHVQDQAFDFMVFLRKRPVPSSELNLEQFIQGDKIRKVLRTGKSGVLRGELAGVSEQILPTRNSIFTLAPNELAIQAFLANVAGFLATVRGSRVNNASAFFDEWNVVRLPAPPTFGLRLDLVFLEVFRVLIEPGTTTNRPASAKLFPLGNKNWGGVTFLDDEMIDPVVNRPTSSRVQVQYQFRTVQGVNPFGNDKLLDAAVFAQGAVPAPTAYTFTRDEQDPGLYRAGDGSGTAMIQLGTVDGFVYAIPIALVARRNNTAYDASFNPNGASATLATPIKDRPDGLSNDEVAADDIEDQRYGVNLGDPDPQLELEKGFRALVEGRLPRLLKPDRLNLQFGKRVLTADTIAPVDIPGLQNIGIFDGIRRCYSDRVCSSTIFRDIVSTASSGEVPLYSYDQVIKKLIVDVVAFPNADAITDVTMKWRLNGNPVALAGLIGIGSQHAEATINAGHPSFISGGTIDIRITVSQDRTGGLSFVPDEMLKVQATFDSTTEEVATTEFDKVDRTQVLTTGVGGFFDYIRAFNFLHPSFSEGTPLEIHGQHFFGNNGAVYILPGMLNGKKVLGYRDFQKLSPGSPVKLQPTAIQFNPGPANFTVTFGSAFLPSNVLLAEAVVETRAAVFLKEAKELSDIAKTEVLIDCGDGLKVEFDLEASGKIVSFAKFIRPDLLERPYCFLDNKIEYLESVTIINERVARIKFFIAPQSGKEFKFQVNALFSPPAPEVWKMWYKHLTYQGLGRTFLRGTKFEVLRRGKTGLMTSTGTGGVVTESNPFLKSAGTRLPLREGLSDLQFEGVRYALLGDPALDATKFTPLDTGFVEYQDVEELVEGLELDLVNTVVGANDAVRGVKDAFLRTQKGLKLATRIKVAGFAGPDASLAKNLHAAVYALVRDVQAGELLLLVVNANVLGVTVGVDEIRLDEVASSFDFFRLGILGM